MSNGPRRTVYVDNNPHKLFTGPVIALRSILFSVSRGVYLGKGLWSYDKELTHGATPAPDSAPTFSGEKDEEALKAVEGVKDAQHQEVIPDLPDLSVSKLRLTQINIPVW